MDALLHGTNVDCNSVFLPIINIEARISSSNFSSASERREYFDRPISCQVCNGSWLYPNKLLERIGITIPLCLVSILVSGAYGLGSMAPIAVAYSSMGDATVCGIMQGAIQGVQCWQSQNQMGVRLLPNASFLGLSGGKGFFCGLLQSSLRPLCWAANNFTNPRRLENNLFSQIVAGESAICGLLNQTAIARSVTLDGQLVESVSSFVHCWRNKLVEEAVPRQHTYTSLAAGATFVCGLKSPNNTVDCWGKYDARALPNATAFVSIQAGGQHACGVTVDFMTYCWGNNSFGQSSVPSGVRFVSLALGAQHSCGLLGSNHRVLCWGDNRFNQLSPSADHSFLAITAGDSFTCGMLESNYSIFCWGADDIFGHGRLLPFKSPSIPSSCTTADCRLNTYTLVNNSGVTGGLVCGRSSQHVCVPCRIGCQSGYFASRRCGPKGDLVCSLSEPSAAPSPLLSAQSPITIIEKYRTRPGKWIIVSIVLGSTGTMGGLLTVGWCCWAKFGGPSWRCTCTCNGGQGRVHHSTQPIAPATTAPSMAPQKIKRQRSSTSSYRRSRSDSTFARAQAFSYTELAAATRDFSEGNKIGAGSFGSVYRGELLDGRQVAIKRGDREMRLTARKLEEKESAFQSELEFLSRVHHKHLVSLVGYCDEDDERMLVYDYMPNGTLHDHLHKKDNSDALTWHMRIKIALEAARGIEYLHTYAMPPIIHRDIKSSNILLDASWFARVSDFGLSLMGPAEETSHLSLMAAGTVGYMDPEYYRLQHLTTKSDVYSFGVVLLEILTGQRAIHKQVTGPINVVDFAVPRILAEEVVFILDPKAQKPEPIEVEAVSVLAEVAEQCVRLEGKERPTMTEIVGRLEHAMALSRANQKILWRNNGTPSTAKLK